VDQAVLLSRKAADLFVVGHVRTDEGLGNLQRQRVLASETESMDLVSDAKTLRRGAT
jgi:hypothetical protein